MSQKLKVYIVFNFLCCKLSIFISFIFKALKFYFCVKFTHYKLLVVQCNVYLKFYELALPRKSMPLYLYIDRS